MRALVLGAGIAGLTTAYELWCDGHEVTVIDREPLAASFTSYANAGLLAPGHAYAWSSPAAPKILLKSLWRNDQALRLGFSTDPDFWRWMWKFWGECTAERARLNTARKVRLCLYSLKVLQDTKAATGVQFDGLKGGNLYLYRSAGAFDAAVERARILTENGCPVSALSSDEAAAIDPGLSPVRDKFVGALHATEDESGDCRLFARNLMEWLKARGVDFRLETTITGFETHGEQVRAVLTEKGRFDGDVVVFCLGVRGNDLSRQLGHSLPIYPVKGYSVTATMKASNNRPELGGMDEDSLVAYCPMGDRLRITATAEFSGYSTSHKPSDFAHMRAVTEDLFAGVADFETAEYWAGLRPMTPTGAPILGQGSHKNLWFNTGLGHMGWTMSHGTARITADTIAGNTPAIPLDGMDVN